MSLTLIFGSMFSGKTEELIRRVRRYEAIGWTACVVNSSSDTRVAGRNVVRTHTGATHSAVVTSDLSEIGPDPKVVAVDEAQFFEDLEAHVCRWVEDEKRHVILSGLSGDFRRRSIGSMQDLIPFADEVVWKRALCAECRDGTLASFSQRMDAEDTRVVVPGGSDMYRAVCRKHFTE